MTGQESASLVFPVLCLVVSFAIFCLIHSTEISQLLRALKRSTADYLREARRRFSSLPHYDFLGRDSTPSSHYHTTLGSASVSDLTALDTFGSNLIPSSNLDLDPDSESMFAPDASDTSSDGTLRTRNNDSHPPSDSWEIELEERILNGRGMGPWLDRVIDRVVQRVIENLVSDEYAELDISTHATSR
ncbi:hypothetical protein N7539_000026 [Penicillium diatomitis]|uniref:Uncharacterized protein n=1 Tax=Penicillium diatomitis TaxID=2819901 RepID=A0A9W9XLS1_9EURO|nr:uncharacterized protein N7539_000026 [Penicillium diatomitis]KAJ5494910.1 hypothetical protein N7539_000026 [Penicillium diatomitis]